MHIVHEAFFFVRKNDSPLRERVKLWKEVGIGDAGMGIVQLL